MQLYTKGDKFPLFCHVCVVFSFFLSLISGCCFDHHLGIAIAIAIAISTT